MTFKKNIIKRVAIANIARKAFATKYNNNTNFFFFVIEK